MRRQRHKLSLRACIVTGILLFLSFTDICLLNRFQPDRDLPQKITLAFVPGQKVLASADGLVIRTDKIDDLDQRVSIAHGLGVTTRYEHMATVDVHEGQRIRSGDVIGRMASGRSTGDTLNFEVQVAGRPVPLLASVSSQGMGAQFHRFATLYGKGDAFLAANDAEAALENYREALRLSQVRGDRQDESIALFGVSRAERDLGRLEEAWKAVERALELMESARGKQHAREIYALAIDLLMEKGKRTPDPRFDIAAFELSERARARALLDGLHEPRETSGALRLREIQDSLDSGTFILSYWLGDERSFLWVVGRDSIESRQLPPRQEIETVAARTYLALSESHRPEYRASYERIAQRLSSLLLEPLGGGTLGQKRLAIIPDGTLRNIPFAALPDPASAGRLLLYRHEIVTLASASELRSRKAKNRPVPANLLAVVADPVYDREDSRERGGPGRAQEGTSEPDRSRSIAALDSSRFPRLPFSLREVQHILSLASPRNRFQLVGFSATRDLVMSGALSKSRILHISTHNNFNTEHPERSGIVLSLVDREGRPQDGLLRASDIRDLRLSADLVVLSSCRTGLADGEQSSLIRSFRDAGASRVMASLWNVDDRATAALMTRFYEALLVRHLPAAAALREAQRSMQEDPRWAAPFYWAAFVLEGDWK
jgi:CHAT domain-containing protein